MILSVSRRTDIPAFYSSWFFNRIKEGFVYVRNPMNMHRVSKIMLTPQQIDCIVFWSKNPKPMIGRLHELEAYDYYFQFTINPYDTLLEKYVPKKRKVIDTFRALSDIIGPHRVIWRYDPILFTDSIGLNYHREYFAKLAKLLAGYTNRCAISFIDNYKKKLSKPEKYFSKRVDGGRGTEHLPVSCKNGIGVSYPGTDLCRKIRSASIRNYCR